MEKTAHLRFAIIPSNGREILDSCVQAVQPQVDKVIVINTSGTGFSQYPMRSDEVDQIYGHDGVNISRWWNQGLNRAAYLADFTKKKQKLDSVTWDVAIVNDDCIVPEGWVAGVAENMRARDAVAGCSGGHDVVLRAAEAVQLDMRMQGFAFVLKGEHGMRANELFTWYYSDDHIDWESRLAGGMAMMRGFPVEHLYPNGQVTPEIQVQIAEDAANFYASYGRMPH